MSNQIHDLEAQYAGGGRSTADVTPYPSHPECSCGRPVYLDGLCKKHADERWGREQLAAERAS